MQGILENAAIKMPSKEVFSLTKSYQNREKCFQNSYKSLRVIVFSRYGRNLSFKAPLKDPVERSAKRFALLLRENRHQQVYLLNLNIASFESVVADNVRAPKSTDCFQFHGRRGRKDPRKVNCMFAEHGAL